MSEWKEMKHKLEDEFDHLLGSIVAANGLEVKVVAVLSVLEANEILIQRARMIQALISILGDPDAEVKKLVQEGFFKERDM